MHGCYHYADRNKQLIGGRTANELFTEFEERISILQKHFKCQSVTMWECEFDRQLDQNPELNEFFEKCELIDPLHPRKHVLRGGRVEPFKLLHSCNEDTELLYFDIVCQLFLYKINFWNSKIHFAFIEQFIFKKNDCFLAFNI